MSLLRRRKLDVAYEELDTAKQSERTSTYYCILIYFASVYIYRRRSAY